jgi:hypothetical protein
MAVLHVVFDDIDLHNYINGLDNGEELLLGVIMLLLQRGADPFLRRRCWEHQSYLEQPEDCTPGCNWCAFTRRRS